MNKNSILFNEIERLNKEIRMLTLGSEFEKLKLAQEKLVILQVLQNEINRDIEDKIRHSVIPAPDKTP